MSPKIPSAVPNLLSGAFTNHDVTYYSAPQTLHQAGEIIGHAHEAIQKLKPDIKPEVKSTKAVSREAVPDTPEISEHAGYQDYEEGNADDQYHEHHEEGGQHEDYDYQEDDQNYEHEGVHQHEAEDHHYEEYHGEGEHHEDVGNWEHENYHGNHETEYQHEYEHDEGH